MADSLQSVAKRQLPEWLPHSIAAFTGDIFDPPQLDRRLRLRLKRLKTDSRMKFVWCQLEREMQKIANAQVHRDHISAAVAAWLRGYLYKAISADSDLAYWHSAPSAQEQRTAMLQIREHTRVLIELLGDPLLFNKFTPWDRLSQAVFSARNAPAPVQELLNQLAKKTYGRYWSQGQPVGREFPKEPQGTEPHGTILSISPTRTDDSGARNLSRNGQQCMGFRSSFYCAWLDSSGSNR